MQVLARISLARRIVLSVTLGLGLILTIFGLVSSWTLEEMAQATYRERLVLAETVAAHVDDVLRYSSVELGRTADLLIIQPHGEVSAGEREVLHHLSQQLGIFASVTLADENGTVLWIDSPSDGVVGTSVSQHRCVQPLLSSGAPQIAEVDDALNADGPLACMAVPVRDSAGRIGGVLMADLNPRHASLNLLPGSEIEQDAVIMLVNAAGDVVADTAPLDRRVEQSHRELLAPLVRAGKPGVTVHKADPGGAYPEHLVAYAPVSSLSGWGVVVEQPKDVSLAVPRNLQLRLLLAGIVAVLAAVSFAWFDARQITRPLKRLTLAAERFAGGHLDEEVDIARSDEVGILARTFETMRQRLKRSLREIEAYNRELEARVEARTREIEERNRQLTATNDIATTVSSSLKTDEILASALAQVLDVTGSEHGSFRLIDAGANGARSLTAEGTGSAVVKEICSTSCLCARATKLGVPLIARDVGEERDAVACREAGLRSVIAVPLSAHRQVLGVLLLGFSRERSFEQHDVETLSAIGRQIGMALANARLYEELQERERARARLIEQIINAQEGERKRIARDLHDSTAQALYAIIMGLETAEEATEADRYPMARLRRTKELAENALAELRGLVLDLRPAALDDLGLIPAIRAYADQHLISRGIEVAVRAAGMKERLPAPLEATLFRVLQEAIMNVAKHARATKVSICLTRTPTSVRVEVSDDGMGFDPKAVDRPAHTGEGLGLLGIGERVDLLGGAMQIETSPGAGTRISIELPVAVPEGEKA